MPDPKPSALRLLLAMDPAAWGALYVRTVRTLSPPAQHVVINGVTMPYRWKWLDRWVPEAWRRRALRAHGKHSDLELLEERGITEAHRRFTREGDSVTIIAGGHGVSTVHAARIVGPGGHVAAYEGGRESCAILQAALELNGVASHVSVHHAIVGADIETYGGPTKGTVIPVDRIGECDVLELDCQGAEVFILKELPCRPGRITVEVHPWLFQEDEGWVEDRLREMGYLVDYRAGHNGVPVSVDEYRKLLRMSKERTPVKHIPSGARYPVVISGRVR